MNTVKQALFVALSLGALVVALGPQTLSASPPPESAQDTVDEVTQWVGDLTHESFVRREAATKRLTEMGQPALKGVLGAALGNDPEAVMRAEKILMAFADSFEPDLSEAIGLEVGEWRESPDARVATRAAELFAMMTSTARHRSAEHLAELGLRIKRDAEQVTSVRLGDEWKGTGGDLRHLLRFPELVTLNLSKSKRITDDAMEVLPLLPHVEKLYIGGTSIGGAGMAHLKDMPALRYLSLQYLEVGNAEAVHLAPLVALEHLGLDYTRATDDALVHLTNLKELQTLWLNGTEIAGPGLLHLKDLPKLNKLVLAKAPFNDEGMVFLGRLSQLEQLGLDGTKITDAGAKCLAELVNLKKLWVNQTALGDESIPTLAKLTKLEELYVPECKFTDEGIAKLRELLPECEVGTE